MLNSDVIYLVIVSPTQHYWATKSNGPDGYVAHNSQKRARLHVDDGATVASVSEEDFQRLLAGTAF